VAVDERVSISGASAFSVVMQPMRAPRNAAVEEKRITPALRNSPRSTAVTTRTMA